MSPALSQWLTLLAMLGLGMALGVLYDFYRALRCSLRPGPVAGHLADLGYWVLATLLAFAALMALNWGELRLFFLAFLAWGLAAYFLVCSSAARPALRRLALIVLRLIHFLLVLARAPLLIVRIPLSWSFKRRRPPP